MRVTKFEYHAFETVQGHENPWLADRGHFPFSDFDPTSSQPPSPSETYDTDKSPDTLALTEGAAPPEDQTPPPPSPPPPPTTYTEADLQTARTEGYQHGYHDGREEGLATGKAEGRDSGYAQGLAEGLAQADEREKQAISQHEKQLAQTLKQLTSQMATLFLEAERQQATLAPQLAQLAFAMAEKIVGYELATQPMQAVRQFALQSLHQLQEWNQVTLRVAPSLLSDTRQHSQQWRQQAGFGGQIVVEADATLQPGDCRVQWQSGQAERLTQPILQQMQQLLDGYTPPQPMATEPAPSPEVASALVIPSAPDNEQAPAITTNTPISSPLNRLTGESSDG